MLDLLHRESFLSWQSSVKTALNSCSHNVTNMKLKGTPMQILKKVFYCFFISINEYFANLKCAYLIKQNLPYTVFIWRWMYWKIFITALSAPSEKNSPLLELNTYSKKLWHSVKLAMKNIFMRIFDELYFINEKST